MFGLFIAFIYMRFRISYQLWIKQGVPTIPATFPSGHLDNRMAYMNFGLMAIDLYKKLKPKGDYVGLFF